MIRVGSKSIVEVIEKVKGYLSRYDIPHSASVHPGVFRKPRQQKLEMTVERRNASVFAEYHNETNNLGWFARFLNRKSEQIQHIDSFHMPNFTSVEYNMGKNRRLFITSYTNSL